MVIAVILRTFNHTHNSILLRQFTLSLHKFLILANRTGVGHRLEDGIKAVLGEVPREIVTREEASRVIERLKEMREERRRQRETERGQ